MISEPNVGAWQYNGGLPGAPNVGAWQGFDEEPVPPVPPAPVTSEIADTKCSVICGTSV